MESLKTIVIENSANCNLRCPACPTFHARHYPRAFMSMETFNKILDHITPKLFPQCALMGWGEPLLDPTYIDKLEGLKTFGYRVGSTVNLTLLDLEMAERIMDRGLDLLNISFDPNHFRATRFSLEDAVQRIVGLFDLIEKGNSTLQVSITIIVFASALSFVTEVLDRLKYLPVSQYGLAPLIMIPSRNWMKELIRRAEFLRLKGEIEKRYDGLPVSFQYLDDPPANNCRSDIRQNVYINYEGNVSPCCMLAMAFPNTSFSGEEKETRILEFGRLTDRSFERIWDSEAYFSFRREFEQGRIPNICDCCNAWRRLP